MNHITDHPISHQEHRKIVGILGMNGALVGFVLINLLIVASCGAPRKAVDVPFWNNYEPSYIKYLNGGTTAQLLLDKSSGTGFQSKKSYLFGHFSMKMKLVGGDSAGVVTAFYLSSSNAEHDEIDFEFLGNRSGQPYILQTNVFTGGRGDREQRIYLWFDPTKDFHSYSVLWNTFQIVIFVDDVPIRVFKNSKDIGVKFPFNQIYSSLWNADDWATRGGLEKTDWSGAPFTASYTSFHIDGCEAVTPQQVQLCNTNGMNSMALSIQDFNGFVRNSPSITIVLIGRGTLHFLQSVQGTEIFNYFLFVEGISTRDLFGFAFTLVLTNCSFSNIYDI